MNIFAAFPSKRYEALDNSIEVRLILMYPINRRFEWDAVKAATNLARHGISFNEGTTVFDDPCALYRTDRMHSSTEFRFHIIGRSEHRVLSIVYTLRGDGVRLI